MSYGYEYYDPSDDPRFKEDLKPTSESLEKEIDKDGDKLDVRDDALTREEDTRDEQLREAYNLVRDSVSYDEFRELQGELRAGRISNEDILNMARELSDDRFR